MLHPRSASQLGSIRSRQPQSNRAEQALSRIQGARVPYKINLGESPRLHPVVTTAQDPQRDRQAAPEDAFGSNPTPRSRTTSPSPRWVRTGRLGTQPSRLVRRVSRKNTL